MTRAHFAKTNVGDGDDGKEEEGEEEENQNWGAIISSFEYVISWRNRITQF